MGERARGFEDRLIDNLWGKSMWAVGIVFLKFRMYARQVGQLATVHVCLVLFV